MATNSFMLWKKIAEIILTTNEIFCVLKKKSPKSLWQMAKKWPFSGSHQKGKSILPFWNLEWPCYSAWAVRMWRKQFHVNAKPVHFTHSTFSWNPITTVKESPGWPAGGQEMCGADMSWSLNNYPPVHLAADHSNMDESSRDQTTQIDLAKTAVPRIKDKIKDIILSH